MASQKNADKLVLEHFFRKPSDRATVSELARETKLAKSAVSRAVKKLEQQSYLKTARKGNILLIEANAYENEVYRRKKILSNLAQIFESGIVDSLIRDYRHPAAIVLFGSFRHGYDDEQSDIDIAVETYADALPKRYSYAPIEKLTGRIVNVLEFSRSAIEAGLLSNIANGIVLYGYLAVTPVDKSVPLK